MPASEETGSGPVIHDHRRIDPVTGQVRGKHVASKPAGTRGAGRPAPAADAAETAETAETAASTGSARSAGSQEDQDAQETQKYPEEVPEVVTPEAVPGGKQQAPAADGKQAKDVEAQLAERTADLQRLQAEYANYRKRGDRDRAAARGHAGRTAPRARRHRPGQGARRAVRRFQVGRRLPAVGHEPARPGDLRRQGRPVRPEDSRGTDPFLFIRRRRGHVRRDPAARLQGRRQDPAARQGRRRGTRDRPRRQQQRARVVRYRGRQLIPSGSRTIRRYRSEPKGRGAAWTEERGTSDEGRQRLKAARRRAEIRR